MRGAHTCDTAQTPNNSREPKNKKQTSDVTLKNSRRSGNPLLSGANNKMRQRNIIRNIWNYSRNATIIEPDWLAAPRTTLASSCLERCISYIYLLLLLCYLTMIKQICCDVDSAMFARCCTYCDNRLQHGIR